jgi:hypothetical protein
MIKWLKITGKITGLLLLAYVLYVICISIYFIYYPLAPDNVVTKGYAWDVTNVIPILYWICIFLIIIAVLFSFNFLRKKFNEKII